MSKRGWYGVDFDGTLAEYHGYREGLGDPIPEMLARVQQWVDQGREVRIVTARAADPKMIQMIQDWCLRHGLPKLEVTDRKDYSMIELWDDRAVCVEFNTGKVLGRNPR